MKRLGEAAPSTKAERCAPRIARETAQVSCIPGSVFHFAKKDSRRLRATRRPTISDRQRVIPLPHRTWSTPTDIAGRKNLLTIVLRQIPEAAGVCPGFCMPTMHAPENVRNKTLRRNGPRYPYRQTKISEAMKKIPIPFLLSLLLFLTVPACRHTRQSPVRNGSAPEVAAAVDSHNSRNALDWEGSYSGILPCPDHGTATVRLTLSGSKYQLHILYGNGETKETEGEFVWDTTGGIITLHGEVFPSVYRVGENRLIPYGPNGNPLGLPDLEKEGH